MPVNWIYYDSKTGNVERFVNRLKNERDWIIQKIGGGYEPTQPGHLITYTTGFGEVPLSTMHFLQQYSHLIRTVSCSGNKNWGPNFALAASKIATEFNLPVILQFELSGTRDDIEQFIEKIEG